MFLWLYVVLAAVTAVTRSQVHEAAGVFEEASRDPVPQSADGRAAISLIFRTENCPTAAVFLRWFLRVEGQHSPQRQFSDRVPLEAETGLKISLLRGQYRVAAQWELCDAFGFLRWTAPITWSTNLTVEVAAQPFSPPPATAVRPGVGQARRSGRRAGDPFDVRRYVPGDDLRRLHWPLYAHSGVLFVRTADPAPPPLGFQHLVLDIEGSEEDLDDRLGAVATWIGRLEAARTPWKLDIPAVDLSIDRGWSPSLLAGLTPQPWPTGSFDLDEAAALITGPQTRAVADLSERASTAHPRPRIVPIGPRVTSKPPARPWWRRP